MNGGSADELAFFCFSCIVQLVYNSRAILSFSKLEYENLMESGCDVRTIASTESVDELEIQAQP